MTDKMRVGVNTPLAMHHVGLGVGAVIVIYDLHSPYEKWDRSLHQIQVGVKRSAKPFKN